MMHLNKFIVGYLENSFVKDLDSFQRPPRKLRWSQRKPEEARRKEMGTNICSTRYLLPY